MATGHDAAVPAAMASDAGRSIIGRKCRICGSSLQHTVVDLGPQPLCESFLAADRLDEMEPFYPLHASVCEECFLVQIPEYVAPGEIFREYAYFSSYSDSWVHHARRFTDLAIDRFGLARDDLVLEVASNDGYLLKHFVARGFRVVGIEPARNVAAAAEAIGVPTMVEFFGHELGRRLAASRMSPRLLVANNVLAQVPDLHDFVAGLEAVLAPDGVLTVEFPHLLRLLAEAQFDTIYHEHFSYFSLATARRLFEAHDLVVFDVDELPSHGGSLRLYVRHREADGRPVHPRVEALVEVEERAGLTSVDTYGAFRERVEETKRNLLAFLIAARRRGCRVAGYGAPGKGNTLLNYCGIRTDFLAFTVDRNPYKHGRFLPGTRIPILRPEELEARRPHVILILPWNLKDEIVEQLAYTRSWGARLAIAIPKLEIV